MSWLLRRNDYSVHDVKKVPRKVSRCLIEFLCIVTGMLSFAGCSGRVAILTVNAQAVVRVTVRPPTATIDWEFGRGVDADGLYLRISERPFSTPCSVPPATFNDSPFPNSGVKPGAPRGEYLLTLGVPSTPYLPGNVYYIKGCAWRAGTYAGTETNVVQVLFDPMSTELASLTLNGRAGEVDVRPGETPLVA